MVKPNYFHYVLMRNHFCIRRVVFIQISKILKGKEGDITNSMRRMRNKPSPEPSGGTKWCVKILPKYLDGAKYHYEIPSK